MATSYYLDDTPEEVKKAKVSFGKMKPPQMLWSKLIGTI